MVITRFICLLFYRLVSTALDIVAAHFVIIVNIRFAVFRQLEGYRKFKTDVEVTESLIGRQATEQHRLAIELDTLIGLAVVESRHIALSRIEVEKSEIRICGDVHTYLIGIDTELAMLEHMSDPCANLQMRKDVEVKLHRQGSATHILPVHKLVVRHVVEIIICTLVLTEGSDLRLRGGDAVHVERHFGSDHEIEPCPLSSDQQRDIDIDHMRQVSRLIDQYVHLEQIALGIQHRNRDILTRHLIDAQLVHTFHTDRENTVIAEQTIVETNIGIHTRRRREIIDLVQQSRIARIAMQGYKMIYIRVKARERTRERATQSHAYYEYIPFHRLFVSEFNILGGKITKKISITQIFYHFFGVLPAFCHI